MLIFGSSRPLRVIVVLTWGAVVCHEAFGGMFGDIYQEGSRISDLGGQSESVCSFGREKSESKRGLYNYINHDRMTLHLTQALE